MNVKSTFVAKTVFPFCCMAGLVLASFLADSDMGRIFGAPGANWAESMARFVSRWFDFPPMLMGATALLAPAIRQRWRVVQRICVAVLISGILTGLFGLGIRCMTGRTRPCAQIEQGWYGPWHHGEWIVGVHDLNSFPSGHTIFAASMAFVPVFALGSRACGFALIPLVVAWARICLGRHHLSDVVVALCLGFGGAWLHWFYTLPALEQRSAWWRALSLGNIPSPDYGGETSDEIPVGAAQLPRNGVC